MDDNFARIIASEYKGRLCSRDNDISERIAEVLISMKYLIIVPTDDMNDLMYETTF